MSDNTGFSNVEPLKYKLGTILGFSKQALDAQTTTHTRPDKELYPPSFDSEARLDETGDPRRDDDDFGDPTGWFLAQVL